MANTIPWKIKEGVQTSFSSTTICLGSTLSIACFEEREYFYSYIHSTCHEVKHNDNPNYFFHDAH